MADYNFVCARIATGAALSSAADVAQLVAAGINVVVDARAEFDDAELFATTPGIHYLWNPTEDDGQPKPVDYWQKTLQFALPLLAQPGFKVLCHCAAGCNRGPSNALAVMVALGWTEADALAQIKAARPVATVQYADSATAAVHALGYW